MDLMLKTLSMIGLYHLPGTKATLFRKIYMGFTFLFCGLTLVSMYLCAVLRTAKDIVELFKALMETVGMTYLSVQIVFLNVKRNEIHELLRSLNTFDITSNRKIFTISRKLERLTFYLFGSLITFLPFLMLCSPFLPVSDKQLEHVKEIFELENPRLRLPYCLYIPYLDTSQPFWFTTLYLLQMYSAIYWVSLGIAEVLLTPFILMHLTGQYLILSQKLKTLGKTTTVGNQTQSRHYASKKARDIFETRNSIMMHQKLVRFRAQVTI